MSLFAPKRSIMVALVASLVLLGLAREGISQAPEPIVVAGVVVLRVRTAAGGFSIAERARVIRSRIALALTSEDLTPANVYVAPAGSELGIRAGRVLLVTVTEADARANETTTPALAVSWLAALRKTLPAAGPRPRR